MWKGGGHRRLRSAGQFCSRSQAPRLRCFVGRSGSTGRGRTSTADRLVRKRRASAYTIAPKAIAMAWASSLRRCMLSADAAEAHAARRDTSRVSTVALWLREENSGKRPCDGTAKPYGIIGYGHMGAAFAEKLSGFGVRVLAHDKYKPPNGLWKRPCEESIAPPAEELQRLRCGTAFTCRLTQGPGAALLPENAPAFLGQSFVRSLDLHRAEHQPRWRGPVVHTASAVWMPLDKGAVIGAFTGLDACLSSSVRLRSLDPASPCMTRTPWKPSVRALDRGARTPHIAGVTHGGKHESRWPRYWPTTTRPCAHVLASSWPCRSHQPSFAPRGACSGTRGASGHAPRLPVEPDTGTTVSAAP